MKQLHCGKPTKVPGMDVLSVGMLNLDGPIADLHLRSDRAVIIIMSKRREQFRSYQHVDPGGRPSQDL
jgi:hypothetical protein